MNEALLINQRRPFNHSLLYPLDWLKNSFKIKKGTAILYPYNDDGQKSELRALR
jgi:hypothetical protein